VGHGVTSFPISLSHRTCYSAAYLFAGSASGGPTTIAAARMLHSKTSERRQHQITLHTDWISDRAVTHTIHNRPFGSLMKEDCFTWIIPRRVTTALTILNIKGIHSGFGQYWCIHRSLNLVRAGNPLPAVPTVHRARIAQHARLRIPLTEAKQTIGSFPHSACYSTVLVSNSQSAVTRAVALHIPPHQLD
jgi:hypothetical protein